MGIARRSAGFFPTPSLDRNATEGNQSPYMCQPGTGFGDSAGQHTPGTASWAPAGRRREPRIGALGETADLLASPQKDVPLREKDFGRGPPNTCGCPASSL